MRFEEDEGCIVVGVSVLGVRGRLWLLLAIGVFLLCFLVVGVCEYGRGGICVF